MVRKYMLDLFSHSSDLTPLRILLLVGILVLAQAFNVFIQVPNFILKAIHSFFY